MIAGALEIQMLANMAELRKQMDQAVGIVQGASAKMQQAAELAGKALGLLGVTLSIGAFTGFIRNAINAADALDEMSGRIGVSAKELSGLQLAYRQAGMSNDAMASSIGKLSQEMSQGNVGLRALGVNARDAAGNLKAPTAVLLELADKFAKLEDGAGKTALAMEIFGKSGAEMVPLLSSGSEGIRELTEMSERLGLVIENDTAAQAGQFNDTLELLQLGLGGVGTRISAQVLPTLNSLTGSFLESMSQGEGLRRTADFLAASMKILYSVGVGVVEVFSTIGKTVGAAAGQVVALLRGDFAAARNIGEEWKRDVLSGWAASGKAISQAWSEEGDAAVAAASKIIRTNGDLLAAQKAREEAAKKSAAQAQKLAEDGAKLMASLLAVDSGLASDFAEKWEKLNAARRASKGTVEELVQAQAALLRQQPFMVKALEDARKLAEAAADARKKETDSIEAWMRAQEEAAAATLKSVKDRVQSLKDEAQAFGISISKNVSLAEAIEMVTIARLREKQAGFYTGSDGWQAIQREIEERQRLLGQLSGKAIRDALQESVRTYDDIFRRGLADMLNNGKDGLKAFGRSLKTTATTALADGIYQALLRPYVVQFVASMVGITGTAGVGGVGNLMSAGSSAMNLISNGLNFAGMGGEGMMRLADMAYEWGMGGMGELIDSFRYGMMDASSWAGFQGAFEAGGAQLAGAVAGSLLNGFAGYGISRLISGGYQVNKWVDRIGGIASAIPGIGPIAGVISGVVNRLFGRKLKDMGIEGEFGGDTGFEGNTYQYFKGGLFRSNKTVRGELDEDVRKGLADQFNAMRLGTAAMASVLGLGTAAIEDFTASIKVSFNGLSEADIQKRLQEEFDKIAEVLAGNALGTQDYTRAGETAVETLTRLSGSLTTVNAVLENLNGTLYASSLAGADMASSLIDLFGGASGFNSATGAFFQNFYSPDEQRAAARRQLERQLGTLDLTLPSIDASDARAQYRALVDAQDRTTEAGRKAWAMLVQLSAAFAGLTMSAEDAAEAASRLSEEQAKAAEDARKALIDSTYGMFRRLVDRDRDLLQGQASAISDVIGQISSSVDMLKSNARDLYGTVDSTAQMMAAQGMVYIEDALAGVRGGASITGYIGLSDAISAARGGISSGAYVSQFERDRDALVLAGQLSELGELGGNQLTVEERQLKAINEQLDYLDTLAKRADDMVNGTLALTGTVTDYFQQLLAIFAPKETPGGGASGRPGFVSGPDSPGGGGGGGSGSSAGYSLDERIRFEVGNILAYEETRGNTHEDPEAVRAMANLARISGWSAADIGNAYGVGADYMEDLFRRNGYTGFATGGAFTNGVVSRPTLFNIAQMGERGSEAIMPLANVGGRLGVYAMQGQGSNTELLAELRALRQEVAQLRAAADATANNTAGVPQLVEQFDDVSGGGNTLMVEVVQ